MKKLSAITAALLVSLTVSMPVYAEPSETVSGEVSVQQSEVSAEEKSETEESKTEESKTEESKTEESKTEESKTEESKTEESKTEESKTEESEPDKRKDSLKIYRIEEAGMNIGLPENMYVVTKDTDAKDPVFEAYKLTKDDMMKTFGEMSLYIKADSKDFINDITLSVFENKDTKNIGDLSKLKEKDLQIVIDNLLEQSIYKDCSKSEYNGTMFLTLNIEDKTDNTDIKGIQYYTVINGKRVIITFQSFDGKLDSDDTALSEKIMQSVKFDGAEVKKLNELTDTLQEISEKKVSDKIKDANRIDIRYIYMVIAASIGLISLMIMIYAAKSYKKAKKLSEPDDVSADNDTEEEKADTPDIEKDDKPEETSIDNANVPEEESILSEDEPDTIIDNEMTDNETAEEPEITEVIEKTEEITDINTGVVTVGLTDEDNCEQEETAPEPEEKTTTESYPENKTPEKAVKPSVITGEKPTEPAFTALLDRLKESSTYVDDDSTGAKKKASSDLNKKIPEAADIELEISKAADGSIIIGALSGSGKPVDIDIKDSADLKAERIKKMKELGVESPYQNEIYNRRDAAVKDGFTVKAKDKKTGKKHKASKSKPDMTDALNGAAAAVSTILDKTDSTKADEAMTESAIFADKGKEPVKIVPLKKRTIIIKDKTADADKNKRSDKEMMDRDSDIIYEVAPKPRQEIKPLKSDFTNIPRLENVKADEYNSQYDEMKKSMPKNQAYTQKFNSVQSLRTKKQETDTPKEEKEPVAEAVQPVNTEPSKEPAAEPAAEPVAEQKTETKPVQTQEKNEKTDDPEIIKFYTGYDEGNDEENDYRDQEIVIKDHKKTESLSFGERIKRSLGKFFSGETPEDEDEDDEL